MKRRNAREYALQFVYGMDMVDLHPEDRKPGDLSADFGAFWKGTHEEESDVRAFAEDLIKGTIANLADIDKVIQKAADKWKLVRIAAIDRNIMRIAAYEIIYRNDIPDAVSINEALEIAKKFSTSESASFINGILDRISKDPKLKPSKRQ
jgi:transcription antitermination protein NusB